MAAAPHPGPLPASGERERVGDTCPRRACGEREGPIAPRWEGEGQRLAIRAPLSAAGGAEIAGLDLSRPLPAETVAEIRAALTEHQFVVFPGQSLSREQQYAFAAQLGPVEAHGGGRPGKRRDVAHVTANLDADGNPSDRFAQGANYRWHTDKPYYRTPPLLTVLYAVELPPAGGDTEFANTRLAYEALPAATKQRLAGLRVVFQWEGGRRPGYYASELPPVDHPLVRTHPVTGRPALYLGNHAVRIAGIDEIEGTALLGELLDHATQPCFTYAHRWRVGDLVVWDNTSLLHRAVANYEMNRYRRIMHRNVVKGPVPV
ncbi:MAG: TauD/TfdA family dioxygenase [Alphaproteobacteria bacterium]|nr:TauD/TfdA family dioxygenase [Alphaproteobacteria bacterium]